MNLKSSSIGTACGTFGELLQGELPNGKHFLVTLPISLQSRAIFIPDHEIKEIFVYPLNKIKLKAAVEYLLKYLNVNIGGFLTIQSEIPEGKGLASSSADIVAGIRSVSNYLGYEITSNIIEDIMRKIEPTDGVMYSESVCFYHKEVRLAKKFGKLPPMIIIAADSGGVVDTLHYNKNAPPYTTLMIRTHF